MSDRVHFETPEDVELSFELAGPGSRIAAALVDYLIIGAVVVALISVLAAAGAIAFRLRDVFDPDTLTELSGFAVAVLVSVIFGVNLFYFVASEWLLAGQSAGKKLLDLRVVRDGGYGLSFSASLLRNLVRVADMIPGFYLVGLMSIILSAERKRLGDFIAGTLVVRVDRATAPKPRFVGKRWSTLPDRQFALTRVEIGRLGPEAFALLDGYFDRVESLDLEAARALRRSIALGLARKMELAIGEAENDDGKLAALLEETYLALRETLD